jgi:hypothetical protein
MTTVLYSGVPKPLLDYHLSLDYHFYPRLLVPISITRMRRRWKIELLKFAVSQNFKLSFRNNLDYCGRQKLERLIIINNKVIRLLVAEAPSLLTATSMYTSTLLHFYYLSTTSRWRQDRLWYYRTKQYNG